MTAPDPEAEEETVHPSGSDISGGNTMNEDDAGTCKCGKPGEFDHPCPYSEDINNDSESMCNCCADCQHECCMDI